MFTRQLAVGLVLLAASFATAQTGPQLLGVFPPGAKAGGTVEVTCSGVGFDGDEKLLFSGPGFTAERIGTATADPKAPKGSSPAGVRFKVTAPAAAGSYDVRLVCKGGLSNPRTFVVGESAETNETEPNNDVGQAQRIEVGTTVNGVIATPTDVDYVTFRAKAGQSLVISCRTGSLDSRLSAELLVATADGRRLAENRGYRGSEAVLDFVAPSDGDYLVRVSQFAYASGGADHFYRLTVSTGPWVDAVFPPLRPATGRPVRVIGRNFPASVKPTASPLRRGDGRPFDEAVIPLVPDPDAVTFPPAAATADLTAARAFGPDTASPLLVTDYPVVVCNEANGTAETAQPLKPPCDVAGRIARRNDRHWYAFDAKKGEVWMIDLFADRLGSSIDAYFVLTNDKGQVIVEQDESADSLSPHQFYTKSDDPARYRFTAPADGTYRIRVSARDAGTVYGPREQFVLRLAPEKPDFRLAVMPATPHLPDAVTVPRNGAVLLNVYVLRFDGFSEPVRLTATGLPTGVTCPPQTIPAGQGRGVLVLTASADAPDWDGFVTVTGTAEGTADRAADRRQHPARAFSVTWPVSGAPANQPPPNVPMLTRSDRGGLALAVRGPAAFSLTPREKELQAKAGDKVEVNLTVRRDAKFKDPIAVFSAVPNFGIPGKGNQPPPALATIPPDKSEAKVTIDVAPNTPPGTYTLVLRGQSATPPPKGGNPPPIPVPSYPAVPITVTVEGPAPKKK